MSDASKESLEKLRIFQEPQCLLETDDDGHLVIVEETRDQLKEITIALNVVAITGLYRTGKSYLMNRLAGHYAGFALGSTIESKTKGIWVWCKMHPTQKDQVLLLLDTEGLGDVKKGSLDHDNKIFIIATLLSSTLVYNMMTAFNQNVVEKLTFITEMSNNLKISTKDSTDDNFDLLMPEFVLCIRDFTLRLEIDGKDCTADGYLEHCLKERREKRKDDEKFNRPRRCIKKYFTKRKAFTFDIPASRKKMQNLDKATNEDLSEDFVEETIIFTSYIYERPSKMLQNKKPVTGRMMAELLVVYVTAMKEGKVPCIDDALTVMAKGENEKLAKAAIESFKSKLAELTLPVASKTELLEKKFEYQTSILTDLNSALLYDEDHAVEKLTKDEMDNIFKEVEAENTRLLYDKCMERMTEIYDKEIKGKVSGGVYMVSGGYEKYKADMIRIVEKYTIELEKENIDHLQIQKAKHDFLTERFDESEKIMSADKSISEQEKQDEMEKREEKLKKEYQETTEKEKKRYEEDLNKQNKRHEDEMSTIRAAQAEKDKSNTASYIEDRLALREGEVHDLAVQVARLMGREDERNKSSCTIS